MRVITVSNFKGGVGKTTTAVNLATLCARHGKRTLLIDLDPQASATDYFGLYEQAEDGANVIGLRISDGKTHLSFQTTEDKRLRVFHEQEKLLEFYKLSVYDSHAEARDYIRHFESYLKLRRQCLIRHNPFAFFGFFAHLHYLRPNLSSGTFFGDLAYALRIQKFFERT